MNNCDFDYIESRNWHFDRRKSILSKHPSVRNLSGYTPLTKYFILTLVALQLFLAVSFKELPVWQLILLAYFIGGFINHALFVLIHECSHNLVTKSKPANKLWAIFADVAIAVPVAMGFCKYHIYHHLHLGEYNYDPDVVSYAEGRFIKNSRIMKFLWLTFFSLSQALRPLKVKDYTLMDRWTNFDLVCILAVDFLIYHFLGGQVLGYLLLSTFLGLGLHPAGGRWIAEHYVTTPGQETYSYYGPLNKLAFNMGYHNEHHDFLNVPWNRLPKLKEMAPEFYDDIPSYKSWSGVLYKFIVDENMSCFSRIIHPDRPPRTIPYSPT
jgi:sphingolipid delta-4 desaturase